MIHDAGASLYARKASVDMFHLKPEDFCPEVDGILTVGEFYEKWWGRSLFSLIQRVGRFWTFFTFSSNTMTFSTSFSLWQPSSIGQVVKSQPKEKCILY